MKGREKRKIAWVTADYFVDCDFNPDILKVILEHFDIHWIILFPFQNQRFSELYFDELKKLQGLEIEFLYSFSRQRDPRRLLFYFGLYQKIKKINPDVIYLNCVPDPYFVPVLWLFNKRKTILCAHDGGVNSGFDFKAVTRIAFSLSYRFFKYVCMFSSSQANIFHQHFPKVKVFVINLALKSFGESNSSRPNDKITFLSFGVINYSKNIELLIQAACNIYEKGYRNFNVSINGYCTNWDFYHSYIRYPELFECNIRIIDNSKIADIFNNAHYFVQPYRVMSQSGAIKVAFNYNVPVIASNLPGFRDEIKEGVNGYLFTSGDINDLERVMINMIDHHEDKYSLLLTKMADYIDNEYSSEIIAQKHLKMFNELANAPGN
jgi:glycosyltransferase involved in cell wall biosynthesis